MEENRRWIEWFLIVNLVLTAFLLYKLIKTPVPSVVMPNTLRINWGDTDQLRSIAAAGRQEIIMVPADGSPNRVWVADLRSGIVYLYEGDPTTGGVKTIFAEKKLRTLGP